MNPRTLLCIPTALTLWAAAAAPAQGPEPSGTYGIEVFAVTDGSGASSVMFTNRLGNATKIADLPAPPGRWLHRRRHMAAEEAPVLRDTVSGIHLFVPTGDAPGNGGLTVLDLDRGLPGLKVTDVPLTGPSAYDPLVDPGRRLVYCLGDGGSGNSVLEVVSYGAGTPAVVDALPLQGPPAGGVTRLRREGDRLLVATTAGVHIVAIGPGGTLTAGAQVATAPRSPVTEIVGFTDNGLPRFAVMVADFDPGNDRPADAVVAAFDLTGRLVSLPVGDVPNTSPPKPYVPAAGFHEPGVVSAGGLTFIAFLLREKEPGTYFTKPAGVAVAGFGMPGGPTLGVVRTLSLAGEPFGELAVHGTRMAFTTSQSPRWWPDPPGGSERLNILYTPLDPVGAGTVSGVIGSAGPLGGRVGVEVTDRPLWSRDGGTLFLTSVNYPGAPNPGVSGSEVLAVPPDRAVNEFLDPMRTVIPLRDQIDERAYGLPTLFDPHGLPVAAFGDLTLFGQFTQTAAHGVLVPHRLHGVLGAETATGWELPRDPDIPPFPSIPPRTFDDVNGPVVPPPPTYGARRAHFNLIAPVPELMSIYMVQATGDALLYQATGFDLLSFGPVLPMISVPLPPGCETATEIFSF